MVAVPLRSPRTRSAVILTLVLALMVSMLGVRQSGALVGDTYTIGDVAQVEGNTGTTNFTFTVTRTAGTGPSTVNYTTRNGSATAGVDYTATTGQLSFSINSSQTITVPVIGDTATEIDETFFVDLTPSNSGTCSPDCTGQGTITNDDGNPPAIVIGNVTQLEGDAGTTSFVFNVDLTEASNQTVTVQFRTLDGSAVAATEADYAATTGTLTFEPGATNKTITVLVNGDTKDEVNESFFVELFGATNATIADAQGEGRIDNDDTAPTVSVGDLTVSEGTATASVPVTLSTASGKIVTVTYTTSDGTATAGTDYTSVTGTVTFAPGETVKSAPVAINNDTIDEVDETFVVDLSAPSNATVTDSSGTVTITDNDSAPTLAVNDVAVTEGNGGTTNALFTVTLSSASGNTVTVEYATADQTATAGEDYTSTSGTLTFVPGDTSETVSVPVGADLRDEPSPETFILNLAAPINATISDAQGTGTINDDDATPSLSINDVVITEGAAGTTTDATFTVTLSAASNSTVTVGYGTSNGSATVGTDYVATSGTLTFAPGETSKPITVTVNGDALSETDETFFVNLTNPPTNATLADAQGQGTVTNDDAGPNLTVTDATVVEGDSGTVAALFTVRLSEASAQQITVQFTTVDGTATAPEDYTSTAGALVFEPGQTSKSIAVTVKSDTVPEGDETFTLRLSDPTGGATITDADGTGTITNDDGTPPGLTIGDIAQAEGNAGTTAFVFTVTRTGPTGATSTVDYSTTPGTATTPGDFSGTPGTLTFGPGITTQTITVDVVGDTVLEPNEAFTVNLSNPRNAVVTDGQATGTIQNDDATPAASISDVSATEGSAGTTPFTFTITLSNASTSTVTVDVSTVPGGTAQAGDFTALPSTTVSFAPGETVKTVTVDVIGDTADEADETFFVDLANPTNATVGDGRGVGTIADDDAAPSVSINSTTVTEGNSGTTNAVFSVSLSAASGNVVTVRVSTADGTAVASEDYTTKTAVLTFAPGETMQNFSVAVQGDTKREPDETFTAVLSEATNVGSTGAPGTATITNDDAVPSISVADVSATEGDVGTAQTATFTLVLSNPSSTAITVDVATANGTATSADYEPLGTTTVTFAAGETSKSVLVPVKGDIEGEADETFVLNLSNPAGATIGDPQGRATIIDDDADGSLYTPITPTRLLDTRTGTGGPSTPFGPGETRDLLVTGGSVPADVTAVVVNVTATQPSFESFLTVFPSGVARPLASNLNFKSGDTIPNLVTVGVGQGTAAGKISIYNDLGSVHVIADIVGFYRPGAGSTYTAVTPTRLLDSRTGTGGPATPWGPDENRNVTMTGGVVPDDATAVAVNVTATQPTADSYLTVYPAGVARPLASNLNFSIGETIPNLVIVGLGTGSVNGGKITIYNNTGTVHVIADVVGYYRPVATAGRFTALTPTRLLDTRSGTPLQPQETRNLAVRGEGTPVPAGATAVVINVTATQPTAESYLTVFPSDASRPLASNLNFLPGQTIPNLVVVGIAQTGANAGKISFFNNAGTVHVITDIVGYMS